MPYTYKSIQRIATNGVTGRAALAVISAGGRVVFEDSPGRPAFFSAEQPVLYPPSDSTPLARPGPFSPIGFTLPNGLVIMADRQHQSYSLRSGVEAEFGPFANFDQEGRPRQGVGDWGTPLTCAKLAEMLSPGPSRSHPNRSYPMSSTRLAQLDTLKDRLRQLVFQDGPRGEKAAKLLRKVRARIEEAEAPGRKAAEKAAKAERKAWEAYAEVALSEDTERPAEEHAAHKRVERLCGGVAGAFRLLRILMDTREERVRQIMETEEEFSARIARVTARKARAEGYSAKAVRALLAVQ